MIPVGSGMKLQAENSLQTTKAVSKYKTRWNKQTYSKDSRRPWTGMDAWVRKYRNQTKNPSTLPRGCGRYSLNLRRVPASVHETCFLWSLRRVAVFIGMYWYAVVSYPYGYGCIALHLATVGMEMRRFERLDVRKNESSHKLRSDIGSHVQHVQ